MNRVASCEELQILMQPTPVGVSVKGREIVKVAAGSQAASLGVQAGWLITAVAGSAMPEGAAATKAISQALAAGKTAGKPYQVVFRVAGSTAMQEVVLDVDPAPLGVSVGGSNGREVTKVAPSSQAEKAGVQPGWLVLKVNGTSIPEGPAGTKAVSKHLAAGKKGGKKYKVVFLAPLPAAAAEEEEEAEVVQYDTTIAKAIRAARAGATVNLKSGTYNIKAPLEITTPITLCGDPDGGVTIIYSGAGSAIEYAEAKAKGAGDGSTEAVAEGRLRDICIRCSKAKGAGDDVAISVVRGCLAIENCVVEHPGGYGVSVQGKETRVVIDRGEMRNCGFSGVTVARNAEVTIQGGVQLCGNKEFGLVVASRGTSVVVSAADVRENGEQGLSVWKGGMLKVSGDTTVSNNHGNGKSLCAVMPVIVWGQASWLQT